VQAVNWYFTCSTDVEFKFSDTVMSCHVVIYGFRCSVLKVAGMVSVNAYKFLEEWAT